MGLVKVSNPFRVLNMYNLSELSVVDKLLDSTGVIVDSGTIYVSPLGVGESARETEYFYDLNPNEIYTLKLLDES